MQIERICKHCKIQFLAQKKKQYHCCRRCFKTAYYLKKRLEDLKKFPIYRCSKCGEATKLNFDPSKRLSDWVNFKCPWCYRQGIAIEIIISPFNVFVIF